MQKKYIDMDDQELVDEWYRVNSTKAQRSYFAVGSLSGVFGSLTIETILNFFGITKGTQNYLIFSSIAVVLLIIFIVWTLYDNASDRGRQDYIYQILQEKRGRRYL